MTDAAIRQRERVCAVEGHVPGRAPVSTSGPLPLTLLAPRCERCGEALGPDWCLEHHGQCAVILLADGEIAGARAFVEYVHVGGGYGGVVSTPAPTHGALTRWDERTAHASVGDVRLEASV